MKTDAVTFADLAGSVLAVPPLARNADLTLNKAANAALIKHIEARGRHDAALRRQRQLLQHRPVRIRARSLDGWPRWRRPGTWVIPSVGPGLRQDAGPGGGAEEPQVPHRHGAADDLPDDPRWGGDRAAPLRRGLRQADHRLHQGRGLPDARGGQAAWSTTAWWRPSNTPSSAPTRARTRSCRKLVELVDRRYIVSGIGERPVITHLRDFGLQRLHLGLGLRGGPRGSTQILTACKRKDWDTAAKICARRTSRSRTRATPIRPSASCTRRSAWRASPTPGPLLPLLSNLEADKHERDQEGGVGPARRRPGAGLGVAMASRKRPEDLRSHRWFGVENLRAFGHRSRIAQMGYDRADYAGKPVIAVINTWNDINPCHQHFQARVEEIKRGVWEAGGFPLEMPAHVAVGELPEAVHACCTGTCWRWRPRSCCAATPSTAAWSWAAVTRPRPALVMGATSMNLPDHLLPGRADAARELAGRDPGQRQRRLEVLGRAARRHHHRGRLEGDRGRHRPLARHLHGDGDGVDDDRHRRDAGADACRAPRPSRRSIPTTGAWPRRRASASSRWCGRTSSRATS